MTRHPVFWIILAVMLFAGWSELIDASALDGWKPVIVEKPHKGGFLWSETYWDGGC